MASINRIFMASILPLLLVVAGCESIALVGRPDIDGTVDRSRIDRDRERRGDTAIRDRDVGRDEIVGTVEKVDAGRDQIHLRTTEGRMTVVKYNRGTTVYHRDRELRVSDLRPGDLVLVRLERDSRGEQYAGLIRMNDRPSDPVRR